MYKIEVVPDAQKDIKLLISQGGAEKRSAMQILSFLQQLKADQCLLDDLLTHKLENKLFNVSRVQSLWDNNNVWRLKIFEWDLNRPRKYTIPYRIIYAYDSKSTFHVLAIVFRRHNTPGSYDYEPNNEITQRILRSYRELGLPVFKYQFNRNNKH